MVVIHLWSNPDWFIYGNMVISETSNKKSTSNSKMMKQKKVPSALENMEKDDIVQAVVIADNFNNNFLPVLSKTPLALLPLACVPLINYTLESLAQSGVHETFLFCCSHVDLIRAHISQCIKDKVAWSVTMVVNIVVSESCRSLGDALRDLDAKGLLRGFFILTGADTISNVQLLPLLEKFKETCKKDKGAVMNLIYKAAVPGHRAQCSGETVLLATNINTNRVLFHQKLATNDKGRKVAFPLEIFLENSDVAIHSDLIDTHIAICSPAVLPLFSDNFDFQTRDDFVKGILMNEEILASTIYWHQLKGDQYGARVTNWQMYQTISQDIIHRWAYPLVPDMGISKQYQTFILLRNHVYRSRDVTLAKGCELEEDLVIAKGCSVDEGTVIVRSVIGEKCQIGRNCRISDSILLNGSVIMDGCVITTSVLGVDCKLYENANITSSILGPSVHIDKNTEVKGQLLQNTSSGELSQKLGEHAFTMAENWDNESVDSDASEDKAKEDGLAGLNSRWWEQESVGYSSSSDDGSSQAMSQVQDDTNLFLQEVIDSLARGYDEKMNCDYLILEINSSRYAYNMSLQEVNFYVIRALFSLPPMKTPTNVLAVFKDLLVFFKPIVANYIKGLDAMMDCLRAVEESCTREIALESRISQIVHFMYDKDIISEEAILKWHSDLLKDQSPLCRQAGLTKLIDWLQQSSEESDEESD